MQGYYHARARASASPARPRIFDCFVFGQRESAILALRIDTLCPVVDHIVVAQATSSLSGRKLAHLFLNTDNIPALEARCPGKLHVTQVDTRTKAAQVRHHRARTWDILNLQLDAAVARARELGMASHDIVVVSEHDEIPDPELLLQYARDGTFGGKTPRLVELITDFNYYYNGRCASNEGVWKFGFMANGAAINLKRIIGGPQHVVNHPGSTTYRSRNITTTEPVPMIWLRLHARGIKGVRPKQPGDAPPIDGYPGTGFLPPHFAYNRSWHLSTFMRASDVLEKVFNGAHPECQVTPFTTLAYHEQAQQTCRHFCHDVMMRPIDDDAQRALPDRAYPPAICKPEFARFAPTAWCAARS